MRTCEMCMMMDDCKIGNVRMCILDTPSPLKLVRYQLVFKLFCVISLLCVALSTAAIYLRPWNQYCNTFDNLVWFEVDCQQK